MKSICWDCVIDNPRDRDLGMFRCRNPALHQPRNMIQVVWDEKKGHFECETLSRLRQPIPQKNFTDSCRYAHSISEMLYWNEVHGIRRHSKAEKPTRKQSNHNFPDPDQGKSLPQRNDLVEFSKKELSVQNYKQKFQALISLEKEAHAQVLRERCDGKYHFTCTRKLPGHLLFSEKHHVCYGYLEGLSGDQISYAGQASETVRLKFDKYPEAIEGDVLISNISHTEDRLYIDFSKKNIERICSSSCKVEAIFGLKFSYFERLNDSIKQLRHEVIKRIIPSAANFSQDSFLDPDVLDDCSDTLSLKHCSKDQVIALRTIISAHPSSPPVLISGPFGSGKTRILALACLYYFSCSHLQTVKILVCTQQHVSADAFYECFNDLSPKRDKDLEIIRLAPRHYQKNRAGICYKTLDDIDPAPMKDKVLIITTCSTAITMYKRKDLAIGFFSHIFLDEGAQMRAPEAVAPLNFAEKNTKIVIAGDHKQIGPAMLVRGHIPLEYGLAVSLMERLHQDYTGRLKDVTGRFHAALVTNYRCHEEIVKFCGDLFYGAQMTSTVPTFGRYVPFKFICSDVDVKHEPGNRDTIDKKEASILIEQVEELHKNWTRFGEWGAKDCSQICITSPTRAQLTIASKSLKDFKDEIRKVQRVPVYDIQGKQFRAVIISTYEPMDDDGLPYDSTKSISNPFVFNTVLSRAQSMVIAVGNPFNLLMMKERKMVDKYGQKGKCWSRFMKFCMEKGTFIIPSSIKNGEFFKSHIKQAIDDALKYKLSDTDTCDDKSNDMSPESDPDPDISSSEKPQDMTAPVLTDFDERFENKCCIGEGAFGVVFKAKKKDLEEAYFAVKVIKMPTSEKKRKVSREIKALVKLNHRNIVRYFNSWTGGVPVETGRDEVLKMLATHSGSYSYGGVEVSDQDTNAGESDIEFAVMTDTSDPETPQSHSEYTCLFIQMELCREYTLKDWFKKSPTERPKSTIIKYMKQILEAVSYIHDKKLIHRDLKPANILFDKDDEDLIKVGDFGLVTDHDDGSRLGFGSGQRPHVQVLGGGNEDSRTLTNDVGTKLYNSPEQLEGKKYGPKVDMYAMGLIFLELNYHYMESSHEKQKLFDEVRKTEKVPKSVQKMELEASLIEKLLKKDPSKRVSAKELEGSDDYQKLLKRIACEDMFTLP